MPYRIKHPGRLPSEIERIAEEQLDRAVAELHDTSLGRRETVHQVRKRCKKIRGLLRLVRAPLDEDDTFDRENSRYRDAARRLSHVRDAEALIETYDALMDHFDEQIERSAFGPVRRQLTLRRKELAEQVVELDERLADFGARLEEGRKRLDRWAPRAVSFDSLLPGVTKTYRRGRKAMKASCREPSAEQFHEWRKRTKYHWYHCRLLRDIWRPVMDARRSETGKLSGLLGDEHDLSVFRQTITADPDRFGDGTTTEALLGLIERRREELRKAARPLGERLFAGKTKHLKRSLGAYWHAWSSE